MTDEPYRTLAGVYEWLVAQPLLTPEGSVAAFTEVVDRLDAGARVLDCAAGIGQLAVGLAMRGFDVVASDAGGAMIERTRALAAHHGVDLPTAVCTWEHLTDQGWSSSFDAVFCVGNALTHAPGQSARRAALAQMAATLRPGGVLVLTSRNWELVRNAGSGLQIAEQLVERHGKRGLVVRTWTIADHWDHEHHLDTAVVFLDTDGRVTSHTERLAFWPFRHETLDEDLRAAGLSPATTTYTDDVDRYRVTAT